MIYKCCSSSKNPEKMYHCFYKDIMQYIFNIDNNKECLISKDPVTMKTGVMAAENAALPSM